MKIKYKSVSFTSLNVLFELKIANWEEKMHKYINTLSSFGCIFQLGFQNGLSINTFF